MAISKLNKKKIIIKDLIIPISKIPVLGENSMLKEALETMSEYKFGVCFCIKKMANCQEC